MSFFQIVILILLSGQISAGPSTISADQGSDGWRTDRNGSLDYIIKLTPETFQKLSSGDQEATFQIPDYALLSMKSVTIQVGTVPAERVPSQQDLEEQYEKFKRESSGVAMSNLSGTSSDPSDKIRTIDPEPSGKSNLRSVAQAGSSSFSTPPSSYGSSAYQSPGLTTGNPALGGTSPASGNPALGYGEGGTSSNPRGAGQTGYSTPYSGISGTGVSGGISSDPASLGAGSGNFNYNNTQGSSLQPLANNQTNTYPNQSPVSSRDGFNSGSGLQISNGPQQPSTGSYQPQTNFGSSSNRFATTEYPGATNQFRNSDPGSYLNNQQYDPRQEAQGRPTRQTGYERIASAQDNIRNDGSANYPGEKDELISSLKAQLATAQMLSGQSSLAPKVESTTVAELQRDKFIFQLLSIILLATCCFLTAWLMRLATNYRNLHASVRHSINLGSS